MIYGFPKNHPDLTPKMDERFSQLFDEAMDGRVPVCYAVIPLALCIPFDQDYRPDLHPAGKEAIRQFADEARKGKHKFMWAYQRGYWFVISDDYMPYFAALSGLPDFVPCFVMGDRNTTSFMISRAL